MRLLILLAVVLSADPAVNAKLTEMQQAKAAIEARQANLARAATDSDRLSALYAIDQDGLRIFPDDTRGLSDAQFIEINKAYEVMTEELNRTNMAMVERMVPAEGWFSSKVYGQRAASGAYLVLQHSDNPTLQKKYLPAIERMVSAGEAEASEYAMLWDRAAVGEGRPQRYGTQMHCVAGRMVPQPIEDPEHLEARRAPIGFRWPTYNDYLANFGACPRALALPG